MGILIRRKRPGEPWETAEEDGGSQPVPADSVGTTTGTQTPDPIRGADSFDWVQFPSDGVALAWGLIGDAFPRVVFGADPTDDAAIMLGDGTSDPTSGYSALYLDTNYSPPRNAIGRAKLGNPALGGMIELEDLITGVGGMVRLLVGSDDPNGYTFSPAGIVVVGSIFLRTGAPSEAGQQLYVCTVTNGDSAEATWEPIVPGGSPGVSRVLGPFPFAFDTPDIENGVAFYTPAVGDILLDAWIEVLTTFDGTTPLGDVGTFTAGNGNIGWFGYNNLPYDLARSADAPTNWDSEQLSHQGNTAPASSLVLAALNGNADPSSISRKIPVRVLTADPWKIVVSQNGHKGGTAVGGTAGAGAVYLVVATPSLA